MIRGWIAVLGVFVVTASEAAVVDQFQCTWRVTPSGSQAVQENTANISIPRQSLSSSPRSDIFVTGGSAFAETRLGPDFRKSAGFSIYYDHAIQTDPSGVPIRAAQSSVCIVEQFCDGNLCLAKNCIKQNVPICPDPNSGEPCVPWDPFKDPNWNEVPLRGETPGFNPEPLVLNSVWPRVGSFDVNCQYKGTLD